MHKLIFNSARIQKSIWLIAIMITISNQVFAQANYMTIFGNAGCSNTNQMKCKVTPSSSSFSALSNPFDFWGTGAGATNIDFFKNSVYDNAGQLLFSVNPNGIYAPDPSGSQIYIFSQEFSYTSSPCGDIFNFSAGAAISEITIFPVPSKCNSYYVMFFSALSGVFVTSFSSAATLRVIEVDINPSTFNTSSPVASWYTISSDNLLEEPNCANEYNYWVYNNQGVFNIVADAAASPTSSRDIYTLTPEIDPATGSYVGNIRKWTIGATGTLPTSSTLVTGGLPTAYTTKAKIFTISGHKIFDYTWGAGLYPNRLFSVDITDPLHYTCYYTCPVATGSIATDQEIWGFEYLPPPLNVMCFAYDDVGIFDLSGATVPTGGLAYATPTPHGSLTYSDVYTVPSTTNYYHSDLELDKNGDMLMVYDDLSDNGSLASVKASLLTSTFIGSPSSISRSYGTCSGTPPISEKNYQYAIILRSRRWYLGSQIRGENYSTWGNSDLVSFTVPSGTSVTWTPTNNPVYNASGSTTPITSISLAGNITIEPGAALTIESGLTVKMASNTYVDVYNSTSTSSLKGGRLVLNNSTLTRQTSECSSGGALWGGVRVWGDPAQPQLTVINSHQGALTMTNSSTISYAQVGVYLGEPAFIFPGGGGIINATNSTFYNNNAGVEFMMYQNFNPASLSILSNTSSLTQCSFNSDDVTTVPSGTLYGICGLMVKNIPITSCSFTNNITPIPYTSIPSYGIYGLDMGITVTQSGSTPSQFLNYTIGIYQSAADPSYTATIENSLFKNNQTGVYLKGTIAPMVLSNTFDIPQEYSIDFRRHISHGIQAVGLLMEAANGFSVWQNLFQVSHIYPTYPPGMPNATVGSLALNTQVASNDNLINNNTYTGLGAASLNNYLNRQGSDYGLMYKCNFYSSNIFDITAIGTTGLTGVTSGDGIRNHQGLPPWEFFVGLSHGYGYSSGLSAGNTFSASPAINLNSDLSSTYGFVYFYNPIIGDQIPNNPGITGSITGSASAVPLSSYDACTIPFISEHIGGGSSGGTTLWNGGSTVIDLTAIATDGISQYLAVLNNINYYMNNPTGISDRGSLYYWVGLLPQAQSSMITSNLLLEDGYIDSAKTIYNNIPNVDTLMNCVDKAEFINSGSTLFGVQSKIAKYFAAIHNDIALASADSLNADSVLANDSFLYVNPFDSLSLDSTNSVCQSSSHWAHYRAENLLEEFAPGALQSYLQVVPDTLLFPAIPDSILNAGAPKGVLAVTEISQGPQNLPGCEYAEIIIGNCGTDASGYVDISGWILDDNSSNFDTAGCSVTGITRGHYRLPYNSIWQNVLVGSKIVVYNADVNCYNLPDTFTIDTANAIFWIPVYSSDTNSSYVLERYDGSENANPGSYCSDTGSTIYTSAFSWVSTIAFAPQDAFQVRCPGCTTAFPGTPPFYQGVGYAPDTTYCFVSIPAGSGSLGGPVVYDPLSSQKFVFTGIVAADFANPAMWSAFTADTAGIAPSTLGTVDSALYANITNHILGLPCCNYTGDGGRSSQTKPITQKANKAIQKISVYPNPATMTVYFTFPSSDETTIKILDVTGRLIDQQIVNNNTNTSFNVSGYTSGIYMYHVITNGSTQTGKILVGK